MLTRMIVKEWKEKIDLFFFALLGFLVFALAFAGYSQNKEAVDILTGTIVLIFLPVFSLLLGASGFASEFRDDAWAYLFSRPVKKRQIWVSKYLSLLTILVVILIIFQLIAEFHPASKVAGQTLKIQLKFGEDISFLALSCLLPLSLFTVAFSLSVLSEKPHVVVFLAAIISYSLHIGLAFGPVLLWFQLWYLSGPSLLTVVSPLIPLSFAAASILTLTKTDFSQPGHRAWFFTKLAALFLLLSIGVGAIWILGSLKMQGTRYISSPKILNGAAYFGTGRGIFRFDLASGKKRKLAKSGSLWGEVFIGGDKVAFMKYEIKGKGDESVGLWVMNADGKEARPLIQTSQEDSPFYNAWVFPIYMSPQGDRLAFRAASGRRKLVNNLWCVNTDGTGLKGYRIKDLGAYYFRILGFVDSGRSLLILPIISGSLGWEEGVKLLRLNLESGAIETLAEHVRKAYLAVAQPPAGSKISPSLLAYVRFDKENSYEILTLLNIVTMEKQEIYKGDSIKAIRWNKSGDKLLFGAGQATVGIYSLAEGKITQIKELAGYDLRWPSQSIDWVLGDKIALRRSEKDAFYLCVLDKNLTEQTAAKLPFFSHYPAGLFGAAQYVFLLESERHQLWAVDLGSRAWRRVY